MHLYPHISALDVVREIKAVAQAEPDFNYKNQGSPDEHGNCSYLGKDNLAYGNNGTLDDYTGRPCIVGQALQNLGVSREDLYEADNMDDGSAEFVIPALGIDGDEDTIEYINEVQRLQDTGATWGQAVAGAFPSV